LLSFWPSFICYKSSEGKYFNQYCQAQKLSKKNRPKIGFLDTPLQIPWSENGGIIVVDDGSDEKVEVSEISGMGRVKIIRHKRNRGYGAALKTGVSNSCNECIVITDADETYPNERIPELVEMRIDENEFCSIKGRL